jgi:hypothetical protein
MKNGFTAAQKSFFKTFDLPLTNRFSGVMLSLEMSKTENCVY